MPVLVAALRRHAQQINDWIDDGIHSGELCVGFRAQRDELEQELALVHGGRTARQQHECHERRNEGSPHDVSSQRIGIACWYERSASSLIQAVRLVHGQSRFRASCRTCGPMSSLSARLVSVWSPNQQAGLM
jgi:hypothetical protein